MIEFETFSINNPETSEQKLIAELIRDLKETTEAFLRLNGWDNKVGLSVELLFVLSNGVLGYTSVVIENVARSLQEEDKGVFIDTMQNNFNVYIEEIRKNLS
jgi:hypothetical protein